jgi:hypothetical protein
VLNHTLVDYEAERIWKEAVVACLKHFSGGTVGSAGNEQMCVNWRHDGETSDYGAAG